MNEQFSTFDHSQKVSVMNADTHEDITEQYRSQKYQIARSIVMTSFEDFNDYQNGDCSRLILNQGKPAKPFHDLIGRDQYQKMCLRSSTPESQRGRESIGL